LFEPTADGRWERSIGPMLSRPRKPPSKRLEPSASSQVDPPREVQEELVEHALEEVDVAGAVDGEHLERGPRLHRRVDVAKSHS
jgi:hypothetical protein